jgi:starch synthase
LAARRAHLMILAKGDQAYEESLAEAAAQAKPYVTFVCAFDEPLAHRLTAAADLLLMPSLYEPCGLNQMYALRYGAIPVVAATGGLADTVLDAGANPQTGTGFVFARGDVSGALLKIDQALALYADKPAWRALQERAMHCDFSWAQSARAYLSDYHAIIH